MSADVREDALLDGRVRLRQPAAGYRAAVDPVLLAAAVPARAGERVLDLGCGVGPAALCLLARMPGAWAAGLEIQAELAALARENAALNGRADALGIAVGDVGRPPFRAGAFDHVMANPPYQRAGHGRAPADAVANVEGVAKLPDWLAAMAALVRPRGSVSVVHRADRLDEVMRGLPASLGEVTVIPLWPGPGTAAKRVIVRARRGVRTPASLTAGLVLHAADGRYTPAAEAVLRGGEALSV
ncbi:tRNA1(Val) A37 N6-methylase TrmN6 [Limimonas halophila]|uniref:tRNA1(Val) A37 N6-methylase TrmN6 n=1 Tax=Limimonas halophila TaxID=1082479 RepID=A0A1G7KWC7_9PROT|nr:methyltransferase [Limimonas halophila]SDF41386.1 tRNA1(Val) A37 N6-methylase TrmN6 [Limimonas halophila]